MAEYKVKFRIKEDGLFGLSGESIEVYEADTAKEAIEKCHEDFNNQSVAILEDVRLEILDVEKV